MSNHAHRVALAALGTSLHVVFRRPVSPAIPLCQRRLPDARLRRVSVEEGGEAGRPGSRPLTRDLNSGEARRTPCPIVSVPARALAWVASPTRAALEPRLGCIRCPGLALGWSGRRPGVACGLPPPAPVPRRRLQDCRTPRLREPHDNTVGHGRHAHRRYVMNRETYPRPSNLCAAPSSPRAARLPSPRRASSARTGRGSG